MVKSFNFSDAPGHLIRRAQQLAVAIFMEETAGFDVTPVQFAILNALIDDPGEDQTTLSQRVAFRRGYVGLGDRPDWRPRDGSGARPIRSTNAASCSGQHPKASRSR